MRAEHQAGGVRRMVTHDEGAVVRPSGGHEMQAPHVRGYRRQRAPALLAADAIRAALEQDATARRIMAKRLGPEAGDLVGVRLNLNVRRSTGVCVHSIHAGRPGGGHMRGRGFWNGEVLAYAQTVALRNAFFNVHQGGREAIAAGVRGKFPMASVDGELMSTADAADFSGIEVSFNPKTVHLFVDTSGRAVWFAEAVTLLGSRAFARGTIVYHDRASAPRRAGEAPSDAAVYGG